MEAINIIQEIEEFKKLLSYSKNIGFFFGAGTSCAFGLPNVISLTNEVEAMLESEMKAYFQKLKISLEGLHGRKNISVEEILNYIRQIRDITGELKDREYDGINGGNARKLDEAICKNIFEIIKKKEEKADISELRKFIAWLDLWNRNYVKEIFTTNYDMLIERAMEKNNVPYFDGFVGAYEPFFWPESIEAFVGHSDLTYNWVRVWKLHGSLNWEFRKDSSTKSSKIIRIGKIGSPENELVIYPSKEKYNLSRKQPFIAYFDRLKNYLLQGELLFIFSGYSFSDQHINEIIFNGLRQNPRLYSIVFCFSDDQIEAMKEYCTSYLNLCVMSPKLIILNGKVHEWKYDESVGNTDQSDTYWDKSSEKLILGDFKKLVNFLLISSGRINRIGEVINGK
ncbi:SIR2 family protein [Petroclostridium sp. X23]|uniref:SIR2 family NAD-dependent protein deacylase n=1 Tax=Petroclostridium sp. X23 TaxID=3045146 RepID=UPI0024AD2A31|nr:SIR2 family protein [Petroclostridium sp. X23]WHH60975.1 SIR2 family protein [Petroclostridium sp. X23]